MTTDYERKMDRQTTVLDQMVAGYEQNKTDHKWPFLVDQKLERLLTLRETDPETFKVFAAQTRTALAYYESARTAAGYTGTQEGDDR